MSNIWPLSDNNRWFTFPRHHKHCTHCMSLTMNFSLVAGYIKWISIFFFFRYWWTFFRRKVELMHLFSRKMTENDALKWKPRRKRIGLKWTGRTERKGREIWKVDREDKEGTLGGWGGESRGPSTARSHIPALLPCSAKSYMRAKIKIKKYKLQASSLSHTHSLSLTLSHTHSLTRSHTLSLTRLLSRNLKSPRL